MAKGHFTKDKGGSKSGYDKGYREGRNDTMEKGGVLSLIVLGIFALVKFLK